ncbi:exocyst complex component [Raphidocelis subcapitata]|uniref:Exocyst complex component n=1 Tax=Raphidocelis subcapitata TaxID=307507 RepID=A0A2V0NX67_9CHLO|nr:exocyst complex component [Raphidocelis subcapitata]|eukprot:GBF89405.1 exocyst complex component [Raphidocelis subcapitata]
MDNLDDLWDVEDGGLQGGLANETRLHDGDGALEELFGDEGGEEEALAGDDAPLQPPSPVGRGPSAAEERRRAMQELARRHQPQGRGEGGGSSDGEGGAKKKKRKRDKDKGGSKGGGAGDEDGGRRGRRLRKTGEERGGGAGAGAGGSGDEGGGGGVGGGGGEEDELAPETDADRAFIDDDGVPEHQRYRDNPEADEGGEPEAEEAEEGEEGSEGGFVVGEGEEEGEEDGIDGVVKRRKKKEQDTELQLQAAAESMVAKMNIAAELDEGCVKASKPATHKVKELPAAEAFLRQRKNHEYFIIHGGLKAAARWLTPYDNGTMPTLLVRSKLVELLSLLPLNTSIDSLRDVLQRSGLGKVVNFHATFDGDGSDPLGVQPPHRWVSSRPMFVELDDAALEELLVATPLRRSTAGGVGEGGAASGAGAGGGGGGEGGGAPPLEGEQVRALSALYRRLRAAVESEVATAKAIFPRPELALELFMQRLFEQDAQLALEKLLGSRGSWAAGIDRSNPGAHRSKLQLLEAAYAETLALAADCERALRGVQVDVTSISEGLWPAFLGAYPAQELAWLDAAYRRDCADLDSPELSLQLVSRLIDRSREATARARRLSAPSQAARNARVLFHCPAGGAPSGGGAGAAAAAAAAEEGGGAHPGCLLEQLAQHIAGGVEYSLELCTAGGAGAIASAFRLGLGAVSRASSREAAQAFMNERIRRVLDAARLVSEITDRAQSHFELTVLPAVAPSVGDHSAAAAALLALLRAAEEGVTAVLRQAVDVFVAQFERVLYSEQRRSDFLPRDDELTFDRPTPACLLGTGMLAELGAAARGALEGANLGALLAEVGRRAHSVLVAHMARFTYSPAGALKWKKDVAEYAEALRGYGVAAVDEAMASLEQVVNVLVVAPESLMGLVNGSLRMAHRDALRIISLREDFKTARVDGRTLGQLFTGAVEGVMSLRV